jgi:hypothetical protein
MLAGRGNRFAVRSAKVLETWPSTLLERGNEAVGGLHGRSLPGAGLPVLSLAVRVPSGALSVSA